MTGGAHVLFYDGVCGLCDRTVQFVLARDHAAKFRFATLQGPIAARELPPRGGRPDALDTIYVLTADGRLLAKSRAVLFTLRELGGLWRAVAWLRIIPAVILDRGYDLVAAVRYRLFGRLDQCRVPGPGERARFLDSA